MGTFDSLNIGRSALFAQRRGIDVAGQNLANVQTDGYSRQRVSIQAATGPTVPAAFSRYEGSGLGVADVDVSRLRDAFLEARAHREHAVAAELGQVQITLERLQLDIAEPSDVGLAAQLADFWAGWDDVALHPEDLAVRSQLLERGEALAGSFRAREASATQLAAASVEQLGAVVEQVDATAVRIAALNGTIRSAVASGLSPNELIDERDRLALELAGQVGATVRAADDGAIDVYVGAMALVRGSVAEPLAIAVAAGPPPTAAVTWERDGRPAAVGGTAAGLLQTSNVLVPQHLVDLRAVAQQLHDDVNAIHLSGFDLDGIAGAAFFALGPGGLEVDPAVAGDPRRLAASAVAGTLDGSRAAQLAASTGPDAAYRQLVVRLGVATQSNDRQLSVQESIVGQVDAARDSVSGVNLDEEMTDLISFQHAYSAAARFISVVDELLDTLIRMG